MTNAKQFFSIAFFLFSTIILSSSQSDSTEVDICTGAVGDVKYSIFEEQKFREVNGDCWVLLDGRGIAPNTTLAEMTGKTSIPDARGVFIRSLDTRRTGRKDVDRAFGIPAGHYQGDAFKKHTHKILRSNTRGSGEWPRAGHNNIQGGDRGYGYHQINDKKENYLSEVGGNETRPKNIILYTYIRID